jgi:hypothetical protein
MPLPKALLAKLKPFLKDDADVSELFEPVVAFENEGQFLEASEKKAKPKLTAAEERRAKEVKEAREAVLTEFLTKHNIKDADEIDEWRSKLAAAEGNLSEFDKLKTDHGKTLKELEKERKLTGDLTVFKVTHQKRAALTPHMAKIHPELRDELEGAWLGSLTIDDKGVVTFPEGKTIESVIDEKIKAKPSLKAPDYKAGAGTGSGAGGKPGDGEGDKKPDPKPDPNAPKPTFREAFTKALTDGATAQGLTGP